MRTPYFTPREWSVIPLITEGLSNKEIGATVGTTENCVKNILRHIYDKLGFANRLELALWYTKRQHDHGLLRRSA